MVNDCCVVGCHNKFGWSSLSDKSRSYNEQAQKPHHLQHRYYTLRNVRFSIYECSEHSKLPPAVRRRLVPLTRSTLTSASLYWNVAKLGVGPHRHVTDSRSQWHGGVQRRDRRFSLSPNVENLQAFTVAVKVRRESLIFAPRIRFFATQANVATLLHKARDSPPRGVAHPLPPLSGTKYLINIPLHLSVGT